MSESQPSSHYRYPFIPRDFYYVPLCWLQNIQNTGELDASDLLMVMADDETGDIVFPDEADEAAWTRDDTIGFVSHVTYGRCIAHHVQAGNLRPLGRRPARYALSAWPDFSGQGVLFRPRSYVWLRWTQWFGKNRWGPRAALVGLLAKMAQAQFDGSMAGPSQPGLLSVTASAKEIRAAAERLLPKAKAGSKILLGLQHLAGLAVIEVVEQNRSNVHYRMRADALDHPPTWPLTEIARLCDLDLDADGAWLELIQTCLRLTRQPVTAAPQVWTSIRRYDPDIATEADARAAQAHLEQMAAYTDIGLRRALHDFVVARRADARQNWVYGKWFTLFVQKMSVAEHLLMPKLASRSLQTTQLEVHYTRERLSAEDARQVAADTELHIIQDDRWLPLVAGLRPDRHALLEHSRFRCNHLHGGRLDYTRPFSVVLRCHAPQPGLILRCRFRVLQPVS
jgi:hypothetical protein